MRSAPALDAPAPAVDARSVSSKKKLNKAAETTEPYTLDLYFTIIYFYKYTNRFDINVVELKKDYKIQI